MKNTDQAKVAQKFYILSALLFSFVILSSGCSLFDCTGCVMAGVIMGFIFYVLFGWIHWLLGPILVIIALCLIAQQPAAKKIINESCGTGCSISSAAEPNRHHAP